MKKLVCLLIAIFVLSGTVVVCEELGALKIYKAILPIYHKKNLQFMIFCDEMTRQADKIYATNTIIDLMKKNVDIDKIKYLENVKAYKLGTPPQEVAEFWKDKTSSNGFITSSKATIMQESKMASGNEKVFFRSPQLDLNGIGFTANFDKRIIKVLQDVNIIIRMKAAKKDKNSTPKDSIVKVKANSMILDMGKELVTLIGNIKIDDASFNIFCDRLLLDLKKDKNRKNSGDSLDPSGVSQISCFGNVKIIRKLSAAELKKNGAQKAFADKAVYDTVKERISLYGKNPRIYRGNDMISGRKIVLWKNSERLQAFKDCLVEMVLPGKDKNAKTSKQTRINSDLIDFDYANNLGIFTGNVRVKNADLKLNCNKMTIYLESREKKKEKNIVDSLIAASGKKELKEIVCVGNVIITRDNKTGKNEKAIAGRAVYILKENKIILSGNNPFIISGRDSISGKRMIVWLDQNRLKVIKNSKIILGEKENSKLQSTTVRSDSSDLNYGSNELSFSGKVKVDNPQMDLICDNMKIFLEESKKPKKSVNSSDPLGELGSGGKKDVNKVVCVGEVRIDNPRARVNCDRMVITFKDRVPGDKKSTVEVGGGSNREIDLIKCFGNVHMVNKPEDPMVEPTVITSNDAILNIPGNVADLIGNVKITESRFDLTCEKMKMFAKDITPAQAAANAARNAAKDRENPDMLPEHIGIGKTKELTRIICLDKVVMTRKLPDEIQKARGDKAVYEVSKHNITLTGIKSKPTLQRGVTVMEGEEIILWTDSERLDIKEGTLKNFDPSGM